MISVPTNTPPISTKASGPQKVSVVSGMKAKSRRRGQHHRTRALYPGLHDRRGTLQTLVQVVLDLIGQDQGVAHQDPGQTDQPEQRDEAERIALGRAVCHHDQLGKGGIRKLGVQGEEESRCPGGEIGRARAHAGRIRQDRLDSYTAGTGVGSWLTEPLFLYDCV